VREAHIIEARKAILEKIKSKKKIKLLNFTRSLCFTYYVIHKKENGVSQLYKLFFASLVMSSTRGQIYCFPPLRLSILNISDVGRPSLINAIFAWFIWVLRSHFWGLKWFVVWFIPQFLLLCFDVACAKCACRFQPNKPKSGPKWPNMDIPWQLLCLRMIPWRKIGRKVEDKCASHHGHHGLAVVGLYSRAHSVFSTDVSFPCVFYVTSCEFVLQSLVFLLPYRPFLFSSNSIKIFTSHH